MIGSIGRYALAFYAICSLTAMAPMNLSFLILLLLSGYLFLKNRGTGHSRPFGESKYYRRYRFWALTLLLTCWGSLAMIRLFPFFYAGHAPEVTFHGFLKIWYLLIPAILVYFFESCSGAVSLITLIQPWWWMTFALMIVSIIQFFTGWPFPQNIPDTHGFYFHATLFFGHHLSTASILIFPAFTALAVAFGYYTRKEKAALPLSPKFAAFIGASGILILFLSYARTAWIALVIGIALLIKKYLLKFFNRKQWMGAALIGLISFALLSQSTMVKNRIEKLYGISERVELWQANIDFFKNRPLTGIGWLKTQEMSEFYFKSIDPEHYRNHFWGHAHSNFFEMLGGTGIVGLLAFFGWSIFTLVFARQLSGRLAAEGEHFYSDFAFGIFVALILLHFNGLTNVTFWEGKVMHQQMLAVGLLLILDRISLKSKENIASKS